MQFSRLTDYLHFLRSLTKTVIRLLVGMWKLTRLPQPAITVFGGSKVTTDSDSYHQARRLTKSLAAEGFSIITGGGSGIMEAANQGAIDYLKEAHPAEFLHGQAIISTGIGLRHLAEKRTNIFVQAPVEMEHFFARKWLLTRCAVGFVVFPGGFGTVDELFEIITLMQCNRMVRMPVVLGGVAYWAPLIEWIKLFMLKDRLIAEPDMQLLAVTDSIDEAVSWIRAGSKKFTRPVFHADAGMKH